MAETLSLVEVGECLAGRELAFIFRDLSVVRLFPSLKIILRGLGGGRLLCLALSDVGLGLLKFGNFPLLFG